MTAYRFAYSLYLQSPLIISGGGHRAESASTLHYIPGSAIRGVVASRLGDPDGQSNHDRHRFDDLVLSGRVRYSNAYPVTAGYVKERSVPLPMSLKQVKHPKPKTEPYLLDIMAQETDDTMVNPGFRFAVIRTGTVIPLYVKTATRFHHTRSAGQSKPSRDGGSLFTYQYILENQEFAGYIGIDANSVIEARKVAEDILTILDCNLLLGRSKAAGYGGNAQFTLELERPLQRMSGAVTKDIEKDESFRVLLLSDFIGRDSASGAVEPSSFQDHLERALGIGLMEKARYVATDYAGGYNRKARTALPTVRTLSKGSVFLFEPQNRLDIEKINQVQNSGLGMRREQGYGEIVFLEAPLVSEYKVVFNKGSFSAVSNELDIDEESYAILTLMQRRLLQDELNKEIRRWTRELVKGQMNINASLLGRLRLALRNEPDQSLSVFRAWLGEKPDDLNQGNARALRAKALKGLKNCRLSQGTLYEWLRKVLDDPEYLPKELKFSQLANDCFLISSDHAHEVLIDLLDETTCAAIDSVLSEVSRQVRLSERGDIRG